MTYRISETAKMVNNVIMFKTSDPDLISESNQLAHVIKSANIEPIMFSRIKSYRALYFYENAGLYSIIIVTINYNIKQSTTHFLTSDYKLKKIIKATSSRVDFELANRQTKQHIIVNGQLFN